MGEAYRHAWKLPFQITEGELRKQVSHAAARHQEVLNGIVTDTGIQHVPRLFLSQTQVRISVFFHGTPPPALRKDTPLAQNKLLGDVHSTQTALGTVNRSVCPEMVTKEEQDKFTLKNVSMGYS